MKAISYDRYRTVGDQQVKTPWMATMRSYRKINGFKIPTKANVAWEIDGNKFVYAKFLVNDIDYNPDQTVVP